ncbi:hypothetical protein DPMN_168056 [Dreissena polymorpha]|uniref:Uncharacterized protein n=1 Tax=Dreissena polymorpha TaxID=45954 RepID=A0A9D4F114_DREPO|nr:hypothetical protein DPMN_168056 [Dreissena polymorpha]
MSTLTRLKYITRLHEGYDADGMSALFNVYKKLYNNLRPTHTTPEPCNKYGLEVLNKESMPGPSHHSDDDMCRIRPAVSTIIKIAFFPKAEETCKPSQTTERNSCTDNLTSPECRSLLFKDLKSVRVIAEKEKKDTLQFMQRVDNVTRRKVDAVKCRN